MKKIRPYCFERDVVFTISFSPVSIKDFFLPWNPGMTVWTARGISA